MKLSPPENILQLSQVGEFLYGSVRGEGNAGFTADSKHQSLPYLSFQNRTKCCTTLQLIFCTKRNFFFFTLPNAILIPNETVVLTTCMEEPCCRSLRSMKAPGCLHGHVKTNQR